MKLLSMSSILSSLSIVTITLFSCCEPEKSSCGYSETTHIYYNLSADSKSKIPYQGNDTLIFNSSGDTARLYGNGRSTTDITKTSTVTNIECGSTPQFTYHHENVHIGFTGPSALLKNLTYRAYKSDALNGADPEYSSISIAVNGSVLAGTTFESLNSRSIPEDSIFLNGSYEKGFYISSSSKIILFNYSKGVLKFTSSDGRTWVRIK